MITPIWKLIKASEKVNKVPKLTENHDVRKQVKLFCLEENAAEVTDQLKKLKTKNQTRVLPRRIKHITKLFKRGVVQAQFDKNEKILTNEALIPEMIARKEFTENK